MPFGRATASIATLRRSMRLESSASRQVQPRACVWNRDESKWGREAVDGEGCIVVYTIVEDV